MDNIVNNNNKENKNLFSTVLAAFDGSEPSMEAINYAMTLGNKYGSKLIVLHVINNYKFPYLLSTVVLAPTYGSEKSTEERKRFEQLMDSLKEKYIKSNGVNKNNGDDNINLKTNTGNDGEKIVNRDNKISQSDSTLSSTKSFESAIIEAETSVAATIVDYAESNNVDLIVVGSRGRTGLKKMLLGSVASDVIKYSHCPVMIIR